MRHGPVARGPLPVILRSNIPELRRIARAASCVLDVGGWHNPFNLATHVIDLGAYETRRRGDALDPEDEERFSKETWVVRDICDGHWPWPDKYFDYALCSHVLEDVRDPIAVCAELVRVARAGYVEVPSRHREIFVKSRWSRLRQMLGHAPEIGFYHHRWFCEIDGKHVRFLRKTVEVAMNRAFYLTRGDVGRKLAERESGVCLFWEGTFSAEEVHDIDADELRAFKVRALEDLRGSGRRREAARRAGHSERGREAVEA